MLCPGAILEFKGEGPVFNLLSRLLKWKYPGWERWGWHVAMAVEYHPKRGWLIAEAVGQGVSFGWLDEKREYRVWNWFDKAIPAIRIREKAADLNRCSYDVFAYLWTALQILIPAMPRIVDNSYTCWEFVAYMCRELGKPIQDLHRFPILPEMIERWQGS